MGEKIVAYKASYENCTHKNFLVYTTETIIVDSKNWLTFATNKFSWISGFKLDQIGREIGLKSWVKKKTVVEPTERGSWSN